jgi:hypothetical protein
MAETAPAPKGPKGPTKIRNLTTDLTPLEVGEYDKKIREIGAELLVLEEKRRLQNQDITVQMKEYKAEQRALIQKARTAREDREVEVYEQKDLDKHVLYTRRVDTDEVVDSRKLKAAEMQADLPMEDPESLRPNRVPASPSLGGASKSKPPKPANVPPPIPLKDAPNKGTH